MSALDRLKLLGDRADPLTRWQAEAELRAEAKQRQRLSEERERRHERAAMAESEQVTELRSVVAELRNRLAEHERAMIDVVENVIGVIDKIPDWIKKTVKLSEAETGAKIAEHFGELMGRLSAIDPTQARAKGEPFKFANEREREDEVTELPNPLRPRRTIN
jgi:seryl-tRNA synthetase